MLRQTFICLFILFFAANIGLILLQLYSVAITCLVIGIVVGMIYLVYVQCHQTTRVQPTKIVALQQIKMVQNTKIEDIILEEEEVRNETPLC